MGMSVSSWGARTTVRVSAARMPAATLALKCPLAPDSIERSYDPSRDRGVSKMGERTIRPPIRRASG